MSKSSAKRKSAAGEMPLASEIADRAAALCKDAGLASPLVKEFAHIYFASSADETLASADKELYGAAIASLLRLARRRKRGDIAIEIIPADQKGALSDHLTIVNILNDDRPFIVDSTTNELHRMGLHVEKVVHPTPETERDKDGNLISLSSGKHLHQGNRESFVQFFLSTPAKQINAAQLKKNLARVLEDGWVAVRDWQKMRQKLADITASLPAAFPTPQAREEARRFLEWLDQDHFIFLGYRAYLFPKGEERKLKIEPGTGLGITQDGATRLFGDLCDLDKGTPEVCEFMHSKSLIEIRKSDSVSTIHRSVPLDVVCIKQFDKNGNIVGEHLFSGLFTSKAYNRNPREIPLLREKVENVIRRSGFVSGGHRAKTLVDVLVSFPRDELIQISEDELLEMVMRITKLLDRRQTNLFVRRDHFDRFISCLIYTPRDKFTTELREKFGAILSRRFNGTIKNFYTQVTDSPLARIHFIISTERGRIPPYRTAEIELELAETARSFEDMLYEALLPAYGKVQALKLLSQYQGAFPRSYPELFTASQAVSDIAQMEELRGNRTPHPDLSARFYRYKDAAKGQCGLRLFRKSAQLTLSEILPTLENLGFRVIDELALPIETKADKSVLWLHDIHLERADKKPILLEEASSFLEDALYAAFGGAVEDDGFNRLVLSNNLPAREVAIFRAYAKYFKQMGFTINQSFIEATLAKHADITADLRALFFARFDPKASQTMRKKSADIAQSIEQKLSRVSSLDEDRILRRYLNLFQATLRTNYFQKSADGKDKDYISFKLDCAKVEELPNPRPMFEIFVCSPRVEAIHLRGGKVARGGIRWSDRRDDFRTEILGLIKAQMVKNTVIVPLGSKGGFIVKQPPADKKAFLEEGVACYKTLIRGMLDITDNLDGAKIVPPKDVVRHDGDDPYLVVAADKGTAKFSDIANSVSAEYGFWLGDAFASGGSVGYDHKEIGITARGGWEAVKRHFREAGKNIEREEFTAIGVGDMAGDVFGNGMLLSDKMKLVAAFNHSHIFVDPTPDPAKSHAERKRLFENPQLTWMDYNAKAISKGGGVFPREAKTIAVTPEMQRALDIKDAKQLSPAQLIQCILKAPAELLWLGGIGTFVKAESENNAEVGDRSNDALRVNGAELRAQIVGEGANLGFTQRGRIEFAQKGGRINTDAIDNSAGVDCSDHEVNIKILFSEAMRKNKIALPARNKLLREMTDEVADLVLRDNYEQTEILSVMQESAAADLDRHAALINRLESTGRLNRQIEFLPSDAQIAERRGRNAGMTRPELAVLLAYSKMDMYEEILASSLPADPALESDLAAYFPKPLQEKYGAEIKTHALRREIIATSIVNNLINRMGISFAYDAADATGTSLPDAARAYVIVREAFNIEETFKGIHTLDGKVAPDVQIKMIKALSRFVERASIWFLREGKGKISETLAEFKPAMESIVSDVRDLLPKQDIEILDRKTKQYQEAGVSKPLAQQIVFARMLGGIGDVVKIARGLKNPTASVAELYFNVGARLGLDYMRRAASKVPAETSWQARALHSLVDDLLIVQAKLAKSIARGAGLGEKNYNAWLSKHGAEILAIDKTLDDIRKSPRLDTAMLTVAINQIRNLL